MYINKRIEKDLKILDHKKRLIDNELFDEEVSDKEYNDLIKNIKELKENLNKLPNYQARIEHNKLTKKEAINTRNEYIDEELEEIFINCTKPWDAFLNEQIEELRKKFKRTYFAIEAIVRVKQEYLLNHEIRDFYYDYQKDELTSSGEQMKRILDRLLKEKKI